ncbi:MAG TPA: metallophosphoesterase [Acidobacteriota bacterium]|jgi:predicted phosphodiesterase|nr:metallophosphoesterase [Acidobacteriota bacterium]
MTNRRTFIAQLTSVAGLSPVLATGQPAPVPSGTRRFDVRFAIASDGHFGQDGTDYERFFKEMIGWLHEEADGKGLDFVIFNGDMIHDDPRLLPQLKLRLDQLKVPYFVNRGNHDKASPQLWKQTWGYPENHHFECGDFAFLLVSTSNEKGDYLAPDLSWLRDRLDFYKAKRAIFPFLHIGQIKFTRHSIASPEASELLAKTRNIPAVFHGHDHDMDNVILWNDRHYFFDGHMGGSWGTNYRGYRIVEIPKDGRMRTYQCNPQAFYVNGAAL